MSKDALYNWQQQSVALMSELEHKQCELESIKNAEEVSRQLADTKGQQGVLESKLSTAQSDCSKAQVGYQQVTSALNKSSIENKALNNELQAQKKFFAFLADLSNKYRKFEGITVNPAVVMTEKLSAEELAHTDLLKVTCKEQCTEAFDLALSKITNVNIQDLDGKTILMHAIINGFYYGVDKLLQKGADVNLLDKQGANALFYCTQIPHIKYLKQIAEKTMDLNYHIPTFKNSNFLHSLIENSRNIIFASELNKELKDSNQAHYSVNKFLIDEDFTLGSLLGERKDDGYTINQEKTLYIIKYLVGKGVNLMLGSYGLIYGQSLGEFKEEMHVIAIRSDGEICPTDELMSTNPLLYSATGKTVFDTTLREFLTLPVFYDIEVALKDSPQQCKTCCWSNNCGGGSLVNRYSNKNKFNNSSIYCDGLKYFYTTVMGHLLKNGVKVEEIAKNLKL